ncbi:PRC-barrel domain-containing protein [Paracoccus sp. R12_1]|uniref:PRC-barrel domain-containing protein n=1 Tax=unclassified Paracoccus (in: a-proteobacteria) TaxID=2688777 RepID=UPI001ADAE3B4|nr:MULTISPECIES: PRC-barrel domain-containing protein [unclassified Paracoccus (in: a-proteobacteria)]MBO9457201.1 PRC-barrel domain-containing protein [Paracoccus sp. R12_2]MBO9488500.1 PRC-barrel domain-containing protein [Paracoccus sp. R12_1]
MRKLLLTTAFVMPLSMGAAFAQDDAATTTQDPAASTQPMDGAGTDPMASDPAADPAAGDMAADPDAEAAEQAAMEAEVAASGKVAQQQAANELRLDWITDATVTSPDGSSIGDINDLIVDGENGQMIAAVVGVGGFLGIGEKQIALPWDQLTVNYDAQEISSDLSQEEADAAPEYVFRDREDAPSVAPAGDDAGMATDDTMAPADDSMAPADDTMAPADDTMEPADDTMAPADDTMAPADDTMAPAEDGMAPAEDGAMPADGDTMDGEQPESDMEPMEGETEQPASN